MKCIKKDETIKRVANNIAEDMVVNKGWTFCSKKTWKKEVRDVKKEKVEVPNATTLEAMAEADKIVEVKKKVVSGRQLAKKRGEN